MKHRWYWAAAASLHLVLVVVSASHAPPSTAHAVGRVLDMYALASGAGSSYGYFAPRVGTHLRATIHVHHQDGSAHERALEHGLDREGRIRVGNIIGGFWENTQDRKRQRALTASWAGKALARDPLAFQATVKIEKFLLPSMRKFRLGRMSEWSPYYEATFQRRVSTTR